MHTVGSDLAAVWTPGFDETARPTAEEPAVLRAKREAGWAQYLEQPMPAARDEEWRRTDPALIPFERFSPAPGLARRNAPAETEPWDDAFDVVVSVGDEDFHIRDRTGAMADGAVAVLSLADAAARHPALVEHHLSGSVRVGPPRKFSALSDAFWNFGLFIHAPAGVVLPGGILIRYQPGRSGRAHLPRLLVVADRGAELALVEHDQSPANAEMLVIAVRELYAEPGAVLRVTSLQEWGDRTYHIGEDWMRAARDARIEWVNALFGGRLSKMIVSGDVHEPNARALLAGLFYASGEQHMDQKTLQLHTAPHTSSHLLYKGAVKDAARSVYQGLIRATPGAVKVDAYQMNNNLILSEGARADALPALEIDADDLKCSHGATFGCLDPEQIFFLRARGLSETTARHMLVTAFFEEVIARIPRECVRERVREAIRHKCGETK